jgi:DNA-binding CsgD family transcriptional regulator/tetratricopeptide (TPR) repeat protein
MAEATEQLQSGRAAYAQNAWRDAYEALEAADRSAPLGAKDLELLATAAFLTGKMPEGQEALERAHDAHLGAGDRLPAARLAVMLGMNLALAGEIGAAGGWFGRAHRLVEEEGIECVEQGYLMLPAAFRYEAGGEFDRAHSTAVQGAAIARRFGDPNLLATTLNVAGLARIKQGRIEEGLGLLDEAMVAVTAGDVSPFFTGIVYCGVIASCEEAFEPRRAREWTNALSRWCESQPQLVSFTGRCLAHRAGIKQLHGDWTSALEEAELARQRCEEAMNRPAAGQAYYQQAELLRLRGDLSEAEEAYRAAGRFGREPQPGLALLRVAQGDLEAAKGAIRRVRAVTTEPLQRAVLLPALVEIMLAANEDEEARHGADELAEIASASDRPMLAGFACFAQGSVELAAANAAAALTSLRRALAIWHELDAPYEVARTQLLSGLACRALGDEDTATVEFGAALDAFRVLGARPDAARVERLLRSTAGVGSHGLTPRELEVLRLVAGGKTNREIASILVVSEHTVARHVQNILLKLRVSSRTAAAAFAFEHELVGPARSQN